MTIEWRAFPRAGGAPAFTDVVAAVNPLLPESPHIRPPDRTAGEIHLAISDWTSVDLVALQAALDALPADTPDAARRRQARAAVESTVAFKAVVLWIAGLHGKTPLEARDEIRAIIDTL